MQVLYGEGVRARVTNARPMGPLAAKVTDRVCLSCWASARQVSFFTDAASKALTRATCLILGRRHH